jgi:hypothetical protein
VANAVQRGAVISSKPFCFSVAVPEGNYRVTVTLGDPTADAITTVKGGIAPADARAHPHGGGQIRNAHFHGQCPHPKISTGGEVNLDSREMNLTTHEAISRDWDDKLTLEFSDSHPAVAAIEIQKVDDAVTVFITGDSTVTDQPGGRAPVGAR